MSEVGEAFGDDGAIPLHITALLEDARRRLERLHQDATALVGAIELPGPDEAFLQQLREGMEPP